MSAKGEVLIVEDDELVQGLLTAYLGEKGYQVTSVGTGGEMAGVLQRRSVDIVILDLGLPDEDGLVLMRQVRSRSSTPVVVITARTSRDDRLAALEIGADDYMVKPFDPQELVLRIENLLARSKGREIAATDSRFAFSGFELDLAGHELSGPGGERVDLTPSEFTLLTAFVRAPNRVLSRDFLLDAISRGGDAPRLTRRRRGRRTASQETARRSAQPEDHPHRHRIRVPVPARPLGSVLN